jgi:membrane protein
VQRRIRDLDLVNQALISSALALILFIPALVSLAAVLPVGTEHGVAAGIARRLALSPEASRAVRALLPNRAPVSGTTTGLSVAVSFVFAFAWPGALRRTLEVIWDLPPRGPRDLWRLPVWLATFLAAIAVVAAAGTIAPGAAGVLVTGLVSLPLILGWAWWTPWLLLAGRVSWRALWPGAVATACALVGLGVFMALFISDSIVSNYRSYGPIGVVFVLLSWFMAFGVVMTGGALVGAAPRRRGAPDGAPGGAPIGAGPTPPTGQTSSP